MTPFGVIRHIVIFEYCLSYQHFISTVRLNDFNVILYDLWFCYYFLLSRFEKIIGKVQSENITLMLTENKIYFIY